MSSKGEIMQSSFPRLKYPPLRDEGLRMPLQWLRGKRLADGAEGLWRVHDKLYDLTQFAARHPGGEDWIALTRGTDITEAFETHHLDSAAAEALLPGFYVREARAPRNSPFTFHPDGFYKTLKPKVVAVLRELPADEAKRSDVVTDRLLAALVLLAPAACRLAARSWLLAAPLLLATGLALSALTVCAHNYFHRRDSWRMYLFNLGGLSYLEWRVSHALSHHLHTNTAQDVELSMLEPFLQYLPRAAKPLRAQLAALYFPIIFPFVSIASMLKGWVAAALDADGRRATLRAADLLPLALPAWMWLAGGRSPLHALGAWASVALVTSFVFMVAGGLVVWCRWVAAALDADGRRATLRAADLLPLALPAWMWLAGGRSPLLALGAWASVALVTSFVFMVAGAWVVWCRWMAAALDADGRRATLRAADVLPLALPAWMWLAGGRSPLLALGTWASVALVTSFVFMVVGGWVVWCRWVAAALDADGRRATLRAADLLPLALPSWMWLAGGRSPLLALGAWASIALVSSFVFMVVGLTAGHHGNTNFFDGDIARSEEPDWGVHQLDTVVERAEYMGKHAQALTSFGDHALHHLFPTLDQALLQHLYPALLQHCAERGVSLRTTTLPHALVAQSRQLARRRPHDFTKKPPALARM